MKTPCLKCGLIHDEPTAICDGYAGFDPDETAGDTRKKAAERIRAVLAAVPIESRRTGRARAAAAGAGTSVAQTEDTVRPVTSRAEPPPPEVPEWRREVSERLESYRSRRERQRASNQSVLAFRVHSKTDTLEAPPEAELAAPAALEAPVAEPVASSPAPAEFAVAPAAMDAAVGTASPAISNPHNGNGTGEVRTYQPAEEAELTEDLTADITALVAEMNESAEPAPAVEDPVSSSSEETIIAHAALPIASEPGVVLADSATLEVHADPVELAEVQPAVPPIEQSVLESAPLASIPSIDTEYWHSTPVPEVEEAECGSLTSGFEAPAAAQEEIKEEEEVAAVETIEHEELERVEEPELAPVAEAHSLDPAEELAAPLLASEEHAAVHAEASAAEETLIPGALESSEVEQTEEPESEADQRRAALRTAARPLSAAPTERIEIRVPQPVFDFSPNNVEIQQPQVEHLPVADLRERRCAALLDAGILGFTLAGFFLAFHIAGGEFSFSRIGAAVSIATAFLIYSQYVLLFTVVGGATPGMVLRGLRVVCFDGKTPVTAELAWRAFGYMLSAAAGMIGFIWSAWDEHGLSWHDRISQTYITYADPEPIAATATQ